MTFMQKYGLNGAVFALATSVSLLSACGGSDTSTNNDNNSASSSSSSVASVKLEVPSGVTGWASQGTGTTGGTGAAASNIYVVHNRAELKAALNNTNSPTYASDAAAAKKEAKIIYVVGSIYGTDLGNGKFADEAYYKTLTSTYKTIGNWNFESYVGYLEAQASGGTATTEQSLANSARAVMQTAQKAQIEFNVPSNTTLIGVGDSAKLIDGFLTINATSNIVVRNIEFQAPIDLAPAYKYTKGSEEWNAKFKAIAVVTGKQLWIDHCTFTDGAHEDTEIRTINGVTLPVMRHDGLVDIEDSSDYITVSYSVFKNHDKTNMVGGSGDQNGAKERAYNHLTFSNNIWQDSVQRAPRARFGQIHVYNNYYSGDTDNTVYPASYYIGMGAESKILSESNAFYMTGSKASSSRVISNLNGYQFKDVGSWYNGVAASAELEAAAKAALEARWTSAQSAASSSNFTLSAYTNELGWTPSYSYTRATSAEDVRDHNLANAGAGKLYVSPASATRPMLDDTTAAAYTVAKALAGSDSWAPQSSNSGHIDTSTITADYVVAKDGSGAYTTIQSALNAAAASTASRVYIQVKAGTYTEQLVVPAMTNTAITLYSTESSASSVVINNALAQVSTAADYKALVGSTYETSIYYTSNTSEGKTVYNACSKKTGSIGKECSTTLRIRNNGFNIVNMTVQNAWGDTDNSNNQAVAAYVEKVDKVVFDNVKLISNQDTLYLANSGKRTYFVGGEIVGDVDFIFGPGTAVFDGAIIRYTGTRKPSGGYVAAPSTLASQTYGFVFNGCVFLADASTTDDGVMLARQWDDGTDAIGKMIVRNSVIGKHIALTTGPWNATAINGRAVTYSSGSEPYLGEYHNWQEAAASSSASSSSSAAASSSSSSTAASSSSSAASSAATSSSSSSVASTTTGTTTTISGATTLPNDYVSAGLPVTAGTVFNATAGSYTLTSAGKMTKSGTTDSFHYAYTQISGDFTFVARLTSLFDATNETTTCSTIFECRAGIMVRNSLADNSRYYGLSVRGNPKMQWEQRPTDGGALSTSALSSLYQSLPSAAAPVWLKLARSGQTITVSYSTDGNTWLGTKSIDFSATGYTALDNSVYIGLMGVSASTTSTITSVFDTVSLTAGSSGAYRRY
jgi:pectate lyase